MKAKTVSLSSIVCPGCGERWGNIRAFKEHYKRAAVPINLGSCPFCGYENNSHDSPQRLLTVKELLARKQGNECSFNDVDLTAFLQSLLGWRCPECGAETDGKRCIPCQKPGE